MSGFLKALASPLPLPYTRSPSPVRVLPPIPAPGPDTSDLKVSKILWQESTYDSQPTQATLLTQSRYYSIRLTMPHDKWSLIYGQLIGESSFVAYPHVGSATEKEHWHVLLITPLDDKKIRNIINRKLHLMGNGLFSMKSYPTNIVSGITYCKHEADSVPKMSPDMASIVSSAPAWVKQTPIDIHYDPAGKPPGKCSDWQLTYANLVGQAVEYRRRTKTDFDSLKTTIQHMLNHTKWRPSPYLRKNGVPPFYENDFQFRIGARKNMDMDWWTPSI